MAATPSKSTEFVTTNLVLAAVLSLSEHEYDLLELDREGGDQDHPQGAWRFERTPDLDEAVMQFKAGSIQVEPEAFYRKVNQVRTELLDFLRVCQ